ncbi:methionine synthase [Aeromicrobium duanguangcaii]|uniref:methionine synthase n=1 Tax=Aeromicrobium duanguangcaii TaxID=2968086 RepID=UPI002017FBEE|nr:methionine synthase [Aeromicrobium duanguangcaii]MCL3839166.1 methionine synthase [Aeromicrobium duanguangcaii]
MRATGIGSMPGEEFAPVARYVADTFGADGIVFVPELPGRGAPSGMLGRTLGLVPLPIDLQPAGWRLAPGEGMDQRRARSALRQDLDLMEELLAGQDVRVKQQIVGPLSLAATVERPRGDKVVADHGARRELSEALAQAVGDHVAELRRRFSGELTVQVDEPAISAVLSGSIPTASGFGRHRSIDAPGADALLKPVVEAIRAAGARPVVHTCAPDVPVGLLTGVGFEAIAFDVSLASPSDDWSEAFEAGTDLWFGGADAPRVEDFMGRLGFAVESFAGRGAVTPACGLAGHTPPDARRALEGALSAAASFG